MPNSYNTSSTSFDTGVFLGLAIGLVLGLLFAPRPGVEMRAMLREKALEIQEKALEVSERLR